MKSAALPMSESSAPAAVSRAVASACRSIAPSWPLDRMIAVNPWWGFVDQPMRAAGARIAQLCGASPTMPLDWFLAQYREGAISEQALRDTLRRHGFEPDPEAFIRRAPGNDFKPGCVMLLTDMLDARRNDPHQMSCREVVTHSIAQHCAAWFDQGQARWRPSHATSLYAAWVEAARHDEGPSLLTGIPGMTSRLAQLPESHEEAIHAACSALGLGDDECQAYFSALLLSINGWASWCAYLRWQAELGGGTDDHLVQLLAIRLAWEWVLADCVADEALLRDWAAARRAGASAVEDTSTWIWQEALERTWQQQVNLGLRDGHAAPMSEERAALQAVFCIDVRSEPMRRALEACSPAITTHGFAGFFGLPIEYLAPGAEQARPQLPGLLGPKLRAISGAATPSVTETLIARRRGRLAYAQAWQGMRTAAASGFGVVETTGLAYAWKLLRASLGGKQTEGADGVALRASERARLRPMLDNVPLAQKVALAAGALRGMSLRTGFAPLVLLVGHGSQSANNPHAASLDCGACCGQTGEVNARVLAGMLNDPAVRAGLAEAGIDVPEDTCFVAALHNTSTDEIALFDTEHIAGSHRPALAQARQWLDQAGRQVRAERAPSLGLSGASPDGLLKQLRMRARDWSQVRPEWGLANSAAFIAAPRARTRHMNLQGRSFLHDYRYAEDHDEQVLELILTAPMVVAHWINMQYYASTVDNRRWGSGNKVLHNVVGANIGVFEGNGGDLRIGLPLQCLHDGQRWVHTPQRLSVWIEAPRAAISRIIARHETVHRLVAGEWLHLFCIEPESGALFRHGIDHRGETAWIAEPAAG